MEDCTGYMIAGLTMQNRVNGPWKSNVLSLQKQEDSEDFVATKDKLAISWEGHNIINSCDGIFERLSFSFGIFRNYCHQKERLKEFIPQVLLISSYFSITTNQSLSRDYCLSHFFALQSDDCVLGHARWPADKIQFSCILDS